MPGPLRTVLKAIGERLSGSSPGALRALLAATIVGIAAAVATYKLLRSGS
jgi:hypothetical protein